MPKAEEVARGGVKRYRTIKLPNGKYVHIAIVRKAGPRGGHTVAGHVHTKKEVPSGGLKKTGDFGGPGDGVYTKKTGKVK